MWAPCSGGTLSRGRCSSKTRRRRAATCLQPSERPVQQVLTGSNPIASHYVVPLSLKVLTWCLGSYLGIATVQTGHPKCLVFPNQPRS